MTPKMAMEVSPVNSAEIVQKKLLSLIAACDSFSWASAWITDTRVFRSALRARAKMHRFVVGTHRYITCANCLEECIGLPHVKVVAPTGPLFHPKVYAFRLHDRDVVYVGSSNLTEGGLRRNVECGVFLSGSRCDPTLAQYFDFINERWDEAVEIDVDFLLSYRANLRRVKEAQAAIEQFVQIKKPRRTTRSANKVDPATMTWAEFLRRVRADKTHGLNARLAVLSRARQILNSGVPFARLPELERKSLAGLLKPSIRDGLDWGYFGQMSAFGSYTPLLEKYARAFSNALEQIPLFESVTRKQFDAYLKIILRIPEAGPGWIGMGTRLLTMKRPDRFVCIDKANRDGLCNYFGVAPTTTNLENYWDRIIAPMELMPWWQANEPIPPVEREIWRGRAALLDAIYYNPKNRKS